MDGEPGLMGQDLITEIVNFGFTLTRPEGYAIDWICPECFATTQDPMKHHAWHMQEVMG